MKKIFVLKILLIASFLLSSTLIFFEVDKFIYSSVSIHRGEPYKLLKSSFVSLTAVHGEKNQSFYMVKKNKTIWCEFESTDKEFVFCTWYFSKYSEPILGWFDNNSIGFIQKEVK